MNDPTAPKMPKHRLRVRVNAIDGKRETHFDNLNDAKAYAMACLDATCIEFLNDDARTWRVVWQDGEMVSRRPGFYVLEPYRGQPGRTA